MKKWKWFLVACFVMLVISLTCAGICFASGELGMGAGSIFVFFGGTFFGLGMGKIHAVEASQPEAANGK